MKFYNQGITFEPRDLWLGVYWEHEEDAGKNPYLPNWLTIYICLIPTFPYSFKLRW